MKVIVVRTNDTFSVVDIENKLKPLQELVGGNIETVYPKEAYENDWMEKDHLFLVDEEGAISNKDTNSFGTMLYNGYVATPYYIAGDIVILGFDEEDFRGLTDDEIGKYKALFKMSRIEEVKWNEQTVRNIWWC